MESPLLQKPSEFTRAPHSAPRVPRPATIAGRIVLGAMVMVAGASCKTAVKPSQCLQFSADLMPAFAGGLIQKNLRLANAWAVKSDQMIDSAGVKFPAYFVAADIIAPTGEAVPGVWITTEITKPGLIYSLSPQAQKYTSWAKAGDASTAGFTMQSPGAKESAACVLNNRPGGAQTTTTTTTKTTTP